ncbi:MAG: hypothetical protein QCI38_03195 [Candidatus Thermoplasmatota archaeon]|nr:hypothetical protein [Candidatus Thermoplasmatota archaeon]
MDELNMNQKSMLSHLDAHISRLYERFFLNPLQFYGETEIHYVFTEALQEMAKKDHKWKGVKIIRECPTKDKYIRDNGRLVLNEKGRRGHIDLVLSHPDLSVGFEFYFRKVTRIKEIDDGYRYYLLKQSSMATKEAIIHAQNDWDKLTRQPGLDIGYIIIFVAGYSDKQKDYDHFVKTHRPKLLTALEELKNRNGPGIRILYIERYCVGTIKGKTNQYKKQFGY